MIVIVMGATPSPSLTLFPSKPKLKPPIPNSLIASSLEVLWIRLIRGRRTSLRSQAPVKPVLGSGRATVPSVSGRVATWLSLAVVSPVSGSVVSFLALSPKRIFDIVFIFLLVYLVDAGSPGEILLRFRYTIACFRREGESLHAFASRK